MEGLKRLAKSDPLVLTFTSNTGQHIIAGAGELHLEICLKDLREEYMKGAPIKQSDPVVSFCETISEELEDNCVAKSPNKHNRIYLTGEPISDELVKAIQDGDVDPQMEQKKMARELIDNHGWDQNDAKHIWSFGCPPDAVANLLVNTTRGVQYLNEIKDSLVSAFMQATIAGIICEEPLRGCRFNIRDVTLHADAIHRGAGQIMPPTKRAVACVQLRAGPTILEPLYLADISVPREAMPGVYSTLSVRRGEVVETIEKPGNPTLKIKAHLPVLESFGFTQLLRENTSGKAFPQLIFSHFQKLNGDIYKAGSQSNTVITDVRKRKGLKDALPQWQSYYDKV
jgi:elongation factor 2